MRFLTALLLAVFLSSCSTDSVGVTVKHDLPPQLSGTAIVSRLESGEVCPADERSVIANALQKGGITPAIAGQKPKFCVLYTHRLLGTHDAGYSGVVIGDMVNITRDSIYSQYLEARIMDMDASAKERWRGKVFMSGYHLRKEDKKKMLGLLFKGFPGPQEQERDY